MNSFPIIIDATNEQFDAPTEQITDPIPVLYQSGYLTIRQEGGEGGRELRQQHAHDRRMEDSAMTRRQGA
ncbi:MAG: hypothetical protein K2L60_03405 [Bacteroides sp.]|nr:hypothetical protein [Bacteroides sp.]